MKRTLWILAATLLVATARAATNDLTSLLQKGLFEEEANRDLDSAISNYQSLATAFDKDRQVAATAIFRLGECYRKLGRTNEAAAQYERLVRDFSDQQTLVTLSQQNLTGMKVATPSRSEIGDNAVMLRELAAHCAAAEADHTQEEYLLKRLKALSREDLLKTLPTAIQDKQLETLITQRNFVEQSLVNLSANYSKDHPNVKTAETTLTNINQKIDERMDASLAGLQAKSDSDAAMIASLKSEMRKLQGTGENPVASQPEPAITDEEEKEVRRIQQLIQNSPDLINAPGAGCTPLVNAAFNGWLRVATYLLEHGAGVNVTSPQVPGHLDGFDSSSKITPLHAAVFAGNKAMAQLLIHRGADVDGKAESGNTPLHIAAGKGFQAVAEVLMENKADVNARNNRNETPLHFAAQRDNVEIVAMLLSHKAEVDAEDDSVETPLLKAVDNKQSKALPMLLAAGANPNAQTKSGRSALSWAAQPGRIENVKTLLESKADPNAGKLDAPLLCAVYYKNIQATELLLKAGANPNLKGEVDWDLNINGTGYGRTYNRRASVTPLWLAVNRSSDPVMAKLLLKYKADPNDFQTDGRPIAFDTLYEFQLETLKALLDNGADANARDNTRSEIPTLLNRVIANTNAVKLLLDHGADPNLCDANSFAALMQAALDCVQVDRGVFEMLLAHKADPNATSRGGQTTLDIVKIRIDQPRTTSWPSGMTESEAKARALEIANLLRQHGAMDELPNYSAIRVMRQGVAPIVVFQRSSNDWNHFTLLDTILNFYQNPVPGEVAFNIPAPNESRAQVNSFSFPDLSRLTVVHPIRGKTNSVRTVVNLLNPTNDIDCSKDVPLEFGDTVEIPEREHSLAEHSVGLIMSDRDQMVNCRKGFAKLNVRNRTVEIVAGPFPYSKIGAVLGRNEARAALMASSDLAHVKVTRPNGTTGKKQEWVLDCSDLSKAPDLWIRGGDVIEVPEK